MASTAGKYKVRINFPGCPRTFYFNVTKNNITPTYVTQNIICTTNGQITVGGFDYNGYEFSLSTPSGAPTNVWQQNNPIFSGITLPGNYIVWIRQIGFPGACQIPSPVLSIQGSQFSTNATVTQPSCAGGTGSVRIFINNARPNYFFNLYSGNTPTGTPIDTSGPRTDPADNDYTFSGLAPGTYTWSISTSDGCDDFETFTITAPQALSAVPILTKPLTDCSDGEITVNTTGGTPPYQYYVNNYPTGPSSFSNVFAVASPSTYTIDVVDDRGCRTTVSLAVTRFPTPTNIVVTPRDITCNPGENNGTITVTADANGNSLQYSINGGALQTSNVFNGLAAGTYTVTVHYTAGILGSLVPCTLVQAPVTISIPDPIIVNANINPRLTCTNPGTINVVASGGTGTLQYSINGTIFQTSNQFTITASGTYTITVRDANGCTNTAIVVAPSIQGPRDLYLKDQIKPSSCAATGMLNVDIVPGQGGTPGHEFAIVSPFVTPFDSNGVFQNLAPGAYTFEVRDRNGCTYRETFVLEATPPPTITAQVLNNVRCFGESNGNAIFTVTGLLNRERYTYFITNLTTGVVFPTVNGTTPNNGSTVITIPLSGYPAGTYQLTFTTEDTCVHTQTLTIQGPTQNLSAPFNTVSPTCITNGSITVNPTGGWGAYTYSIVPNAGVTVSGNVFSNLLSNTDYTITVTDANGCQRQVNHRFDDPPAVNATITGDFCYDGTNAASLLVTTTSGTAPFEFSLNGNPFVPSNTSTPPNSHTFSNLLPGTYNIVVRDANGCTRPFASNVIAPQLTITAALQKDITCAPAPTNAIITGTVSGGTNPTVTVNYTGSGTPPPFTGFPYNTSVPGTYTFTASFTNPDGTICSAVSNQVPVTAPQDPTATATATSVLCNGENNGSVTITPSLGVPPYTITFNGNTVTTSTAVTFNNLPAGTYPYTVVDTKGCPFTDSVTISQPTVLTATASITTNYTCTSTGVITVTVPTTVPVTGTPPYSYSINGGPFQLSNIFTGLTAGSYVITVRDNNNCTYTIPTPFVIDPLTPPTDLTFSPSGFTCPANTINMTVNVTATGGATGIFNLSDYITSKCCGFKYRWYIY